MAKVKAKEPPKRRSWMAESAGTRTGAGPHRDARTVRQGTRAERRKRAATDGW